MSKLLFIIVLMDLALPSLANAQTASPVKQASQTEAKELYLAYCASCHGTSGKGDGPVAKTLKTPPSNLTTLAARNGGRFPETKVMGAIKAGPGAPAHGSEVMPVWGPIFREVTGAATEGEVQLKIYNLMEYIKALQV